LAQPEGGGELDYRPVINKVATLDQPVYALQVKVQGAHSLTTLITTGNHPFWVDTPLAHNDHWLAAECLEPGFILQLADGSQASVHAAGLIRRTQHNHILFAADDRAGIGMVLGLEEGRISLVDDSWARDLGKLGKMGPRKTPWRACRPPTLRLSIGES
jgi:hypothetical protein